MHRQLHVHPAPSRADQHRFQFLRRAVNEDVEAAVQQGQRRDAPYLQAGQPLRLSPGGHSHLLFAHRRRHLLQVEFAVAGDHHQHRFGARRGAQHHQRFVDHRRRLAHRLRHPDGAVNGIGERVNLEGDVSFCQQAGAVEGDGHGVPPVVRWEQCTPPAGICQPAGRQMSGKKEPFDYHRDGYLVPKSLC